MLRCDNACLNNRVAAKHMQSQFPERYGECMKTEGECQAFEMCKSGGKGTVYCKVIVQKTESESQLSRKSKG